MIDARSTLRRRFVTLTALRWLSSGMLVPVFVVLLKARDLSVSQIGVIFAVYTGVAAVLEVPTGGMADTWGRRPTLLTASATTMIGFIGLPAAGCPPRVTRSCCDSRSRYSSRLHSRRSNWSA